MHKPLRLVRVLAIGLMACVAGCSMLAPDSSDIKTRIEVQRATLDVINSAPDPSARAETVQHIVAGAGNVLFGEKVTISELERAITYRLSNHQLSIEDLLLIQSIAREVGEAVYRSTGSDVLRQNDLIALENVLRWVLAAASGV